MPRRHITKSLQQQNSLSGRNAANSRFTSPTSASEKHGKPSARSANHEAKQTQYDDSSPGQHRKAKSPLKRHSPREAFWTNTKAGSKRTLTISTTISGFSPASL